jgi:hypothetical protein
VWADAGRGGGDDAVGSDPAERDPVLGAHGRPDGGECDGHRPHQPRIAAMNARARQSSSATWLTSSVAGIAMNSIDCSTTVRFSLKCRSDSRATSRMVPNSTPMAVTLSSPASSRTGSLTQETARTTTVSTGGLKCSGTPPRRDSSPVSQPPPPPRSPAAASAEPGLATVPATDPPWRAKRPDAGRDREVERVWPRCTCTARVPART